MSAALVYGNEKRAQKSGITPRKLYTKSASVKSKMFHEKSSRFLREKFHMLTWATEHFSIGEHFVSTKTAACTFFLIACE